MSSFVISFPMTSDITFNNVKIETTNKLTLNINADINLE